MADGKFLDFDKVTSSGLESCLLFLEFTIDKAEIEQKQIQKNG